SRLHAPRRLARGSRDGRPGAPGAGRDAFASHAGCGRCPMTTRRTRPMRTEPLHSWNLTTTEARDLQKVLASRVDVASPLPRWKLVAAADVSYSKFENWLCAAVVVMRADTLELVERVGLIGDATFPYVPGLLSFREAPTVLEAFERLTHRPDVVLCDGQGLAHPRRMGLACHLGLWLGVPTVGCAKSWLVGEYTEPGAERGDHSPLIDRGDVVGRSSGLAGM